MKKTLIISKQQRYEGNLILVNASHPLVQQRPRILVSVGAERNVLLRRQAEIMLERLMAGVNGWEQVVPVSGWRSMEEQQKIWDDSIQQDGLEFTQKYVAFPGQSEHQTGLAIDLGEKQDVIDFICPEFPYTGICQQVRERAAAYGFVERYPAGKEKITGIGHEPWHFRYVGTPHARIMRKMEFTLEEYLMFLKEYRYGENPYVYWDGDRKIEISYLPFSDKEETEILADEDKLYRISGDNDEGFIITEWRRTRAYERESERKWRA